MGKGKGRQSGGFGSKALRAAHHTEWQARAHEELSSLRQSRKARSKNAATTSSLSSTRPTLKRQLSQLRGLLQERQWHDRQEERVVVPSALQSKSTVRRTKPGKIVYFRDDLYRRDGSYCNNRVPLLSSLCLQVLAPVLREYQSALGSEGLHHALSLLPPETLTALSVLVSSSTEAFDLTLARAVIHHPHVSRVSLWGPCDTSGGEESENEVWTDEKLVSLLPSQHESWRHYRVPDSWEDYTEDAYEFSLSSSSAMRTCLPYERLELCNLRSLSSDAVSAFLQKCPRLTHLSLCGSIKYNEGPFLLLQLPKILPHLSMLDLSHCSWVTEGLLRRVLRLYKINDTKGAAANIPIIRAAGCTSMTESITLELEFPEHLLFQDYCDDKETQ